MIKLRTINWALCVIAAVTMYPLSYGPASQLIRQGYLPRVTLRIYQPAIRATNLTPQPIRSWTHAYYGWWLFRDSV